MVQEVCGAMLENLVNLTKKFLKNVVMRFYLFIAYQWLIR
jgi:hypothetical protein